MTTLKFKKITDKALYERFRSIKRRCYDKNNIGYSSYGGRGIIMCDEWLNDYSKFEKWAFENGYKKELQIDRINNDGNYEPSNCRWVDGSKNCNNRRDNHIIEYMGYKKTLYEWSEILNVNYAKLRGQIDQYNKNDIQTAFVMTFFYSPDKSYNNFDYDEVLLLMNDYIKNRIKPKLKFKKENKDVVTPRQENEGDLFDLFSYKDYKIGKNPTIVDLGISFEIPRGYGLRIYPRSSLCLKKGLACSNSLGIIDTYYRNNIGFITHSINGEEIEIKRGDKIAQLELVKLINIELEEVSELDMSNDRQGGFGSTGDKK